MTSLTPLEIEILRKLLEGDDPRLQALRRQAELARAESRELTGVGFFTKLSFATQPSPLPFEPSLTFGDVVGQAPGLRRGAGFLLYIRAGLLDMIEGYTFDEPWPTDTAQMVISFEGGHRDWDTFRSQLGDKAS